MRYRKLGRSDLYVSEIGLGCEHLQGQSPDTIDAVVNAALAHGINLFDIFMSEPNVRTNIGRALAGRRDSVILQGHIGAGWIDGQYCRTRSLESCKFFFEDFMSRLQTDYVDIGMLHFVDTQEDYARVFQSEILPYAQRLKESGVIRAIGMSSHDPVAALQAVGSGSIDVLMFSINPAYDLLPEDTEIDDLFKAESFQNETLLGINPIRDELYKTCEATGCAITVMKSLGAGALLHADTSPFGVALTVPQCIHYCLTRPAVASVLVGSKSPDEVAASVAYETTPDPERDYSVLLSSTPTYSLKGKCMYCNHCLPCPAHLDIAQINKYLDLAQLHAPIPDTVKAHYQALDHHAGDCVQCGSCEQNCPFSVPVRDRMRGAQRVFGF